MRGRRGRRAAGTIPAGAGSSARGRRRGPPRRDHPRGCGEQRLAGARGALPPGPSPRVRGADGGTIPVYGAQGTIPAGAGSRALLLLRQSAAWDHPRGCGEQRRPHGGAGASGGPSPRVRGAARPAEARVLPGGTIPAGAGSSSLRSRSARASRDHPRGCGEQLQEKIPEWWEAGPSPRVRGAAHSRTDVEKSGGTIPAGAGSSPGRRAGFRSRRDHPRGCGEQSSSSQSSSSASGPSPRVRGAVPHKRRQPRQGGTIPAGAGSRST